MLAPQSQATALQDAATPSEEDSSNDTEASKVSVVSEAVIPICKFHIAFCCSFIRTFCFVEKLVANEEFSVLLPQSHYFQTLFGSIISPNAP